VTWSKVDDKLHGHIKVRRAREAMALWVVALSYCADELTDGFVAADVPELLMGDAGPAMAAKLATVGLWDAVEGGWRFHDYHDYNPNADDERERRAEISRKRAEAGRKGADARWQTGKPDGKRHGKSVATGVATPRQTNGPVPDPEPGKTVAVSAEAGTTAGARDPAPETAAATEEPDRPLTDLDAFELVARLATRSRGRVRLTVIGAAEREFRAALAGLARQGWTLRGFDDWADCAAAGRDEFWRGEYRTLELLGAVGDDGRRPATGLIRCLEGGRDWRRGLEAEAARRAVPVVKLVRHDAAPDLAAVGRGAAEALAAIRRGRRG